MLEMKEDQFESGERSFKEKFHSAFGQSRIQDEFQRVTPLIFLEINKKHVVKYKRNVGIRVQIFLYMKTLFPLFQNRIHDGVKVGTSIEIFAAIACEFVIMSVEFPCFVHVIEDHEQLFNAMVAVFQNA